MIKFLFEIMVKMVSFVVTPDSTFKILWDCVVFVLLFLNILYIPINQCFQGKHKLDISYLEYTFLYALPGWVGKYIYDKPK